MSMENEVLVRRFFEELCNERKDGVADEIVAADYESHGPQAPPAGARGVKARVGRVPGRARRLLGRAGRPAAGDRAIVRWIGARDPQGELMGVPRPARPSPSRRSRSSASPTAGSPRSGRSGMRSACCNRSARWRPHEPIGRSIRRQSAIGRPRTRVLAPRAAATPARSLGIALPLNDRWSHASGPSRRTCESTNQVSSAQADSRACRTSAHPGAWPRVRVGHQIEPGRDAWCYPASRELLTAERRLGAGAAHSNLQRTGHQAGITPCGVTEQRHHRGHGSASFVGEASAPRAGGRSRSARSERRRTTGAGRRYEALHRWTARGGAAGSRRVRSRCSSRGRNHRPRRCAHREECSRHAVVAG